MTFHYAHSTILAFHLAFDLSNLPPCPPSIVHHNNHLDVSSWRLVPANFHRAHHHHQSSTTTTILTSHLASHPQKKKAINFQFLQLSMVVTNYHDNDQQAH
jgi:hypothetical protein